MALWYHRIDSYKWIEGSIRQDLLPDERSVWADFLALASLTREPRRGYIERSQGVPYPKQVLLSKLNITEELFDRAEQKNIAEGRLVKSSDGTYYIMNYDHYNNVTEYEKLKHQKAVANEKSRQNRRTLTGSAQALTREINALRKAIPARFKRLEDDRICDTETGVIYISDSTDKGEHDE